MKKIIIALFFIFKTYSIQATQFGPVEMTDPLTNEKVPAFTVMSYGSYIYNWPSKYDLIFWPLSDEKWICINLKNGYAAFNNDFEKITEAEKTNLKKWLAGNYSQKRMPTTHIEKLLWLEQLYRQRQMDDDFWSQFYRLMAYVYSDNPDKSIEYVKKAIPLLHVKLKSKPKGIKRIEVLFLLGDYYRRLNEPEKSLKYFKKVKAARYKDNDGKTKTGHPYFMEMINDRENLLKNQSFSNPDIIEH
ncbi:MAG: DUF2225 domain-containing protein [Spirochaetia bacterium]|nr:DUF2225 domain-containing protein [Spirochaetia bacterium]